MIKMRYSLPESEENGANGEIITTTKTHSFDDADPDVIVQELEKLSAKGYDITVSLKLKQPKD